jgi:hypothetical protein
MATAKTPEPAAEESEYTKDGKDGKPVGPEHDASFSAPDFYDPKTGKRVETPWDSEQQKNDPGYDPKVMAGTVEQPASESTSSTTSSSSSS